MFCCYKSGRLNLIDTQSFMSIKRSGYNNGKNGLVSPCPRSTTIKVSHNKFKFLNSKVTSTLGCVSLIKFSFLGKEGLLKRREELTSPCYMRWRHGLCGMCSWTKVFLHPSKVGYIAFVVTSMKWAHLSSPFLKCEFVTLWVGRLLFQKSTSPI